MTQSRLSQTAWRMRGIASASEADSTSTRVVTCCVARRRSLALRMRSARSSERAVIPMNVAKAKIVSTTTMARPTSALTRPARCAHSLSEPRPAGMRIAAGNSRRARTPPASLLVITEAKPRSGRAQKIPTPSTRKETAVGNAMGM